MDPSTIFCEVLHAWQFQPDWANDRQQCPIVGSSLVNRESTRGDSRRPKVAQFPTSLGFSTKAIGLSPRPPARSSCHRKLFLSVHLAVAKRLINMFHLSSSHQRKKKLHQFLRTKFHPVIIESPIVQFHNFIVNHEINYVPAAGLGSKSYWIMFPWQAITNNESTARLATLHVESRCA